MLEHFKVGNPIVHGMHGRAIWPEVPRNALILAR